MHTGQSKSSNYAFMIYFVDTPGLGGCNNDGNPYAWTAL